MCHVRSNHKDVDPGIHDYQALGLIFHKLVQKVEVVFVLHWNYGVWPSIYNQKSQDD